MGYFSPTVDMVELVAPPEVYAEAGHLNNVSAIMLGTNLNEGRFLMYGVRFRKESAPSS
jgi:hypothetical protein